MKILHTSDWHLGRTLYGRRRYEEFESFLDWLTRIMMDEAVDILLVAGDVFDSGTPSNRAQELYYGFLSRASSCCRHVVIIAGNHDSPSFLEAPRNLLKSLHVHVLGRASSPEDEVVVLSGDGGPELIVCAVPYLRDRDVRFSDEGESVEEKDRRLVDGIRDHYASVLALAEARRGELGPHVPVVVMGHLFTAGGRTIDGDGVRELYVGSLAHVSAGIFPDNLDYLALGHLHVPQRVGGSEIMRYSGSPIPMGFGEAGQEKSVCLVEFDGRCPSIRLCPVPSFQKLCRIRGDWETIAERIAELSMGGDSPWLEVIYEGDLLVDDLRERVDAAVDGTGVEVLRVTDRRCVRMAMERLEDDEVLAELTTSDVFERCLDAHDVPEEQRSELLRSYGEILSSLQDDDVRAE
ncbi:MAG: exonuclease sbcCD subunit D [Dethiosulfovibrio peptidovorans]|nr:MAG: exonuclease sbcCD subunit D [Dethiosulfovibrio peptidovorans]